MIPFIYICFEESRRSRRPHPRSSLYLRGFATVGGFPAARVRAGGPRPSSRHPPRRAPAAVPPAAAPAAERPSGDQITRRVAPPGTARRARVAGAPPRHAEFAPTPAHSRSAPPPPCAQDAGIGARAIHVHSRRMGGPAQPRPIYGHSRGPCHVVQGRRRGSRGGACAPPRGGFRPHCRACPPTETRAGARARHGARRRAASLIGL